MVLIYHNVFSQFNTTFVIKNRSDSIIKFPFRKNSNPQIKVLNKSSDTIIIFYDKVPDGYMHFSNGDSCAYYDYISSVKPNNNGKYKYNCNIELFKKKISFIIVECFEDYYFFKRTKRYTFKLLKIIKKDKLQTKLLVPFVPQLVSR